MLKEQSYKGVENKCRHNRPRYRTVTLSGITRVAFFVLPMLVELVLLFALTVFLRNRFEIVYSILQWASFAAVAYIIIKKNNPYAIKWVIIILALPVYGLFLYLVFARSDIIDGLKGGRNKRLHVSMEWGGNFLRKNQQVYEDFKRTHPDKKKIADYLGRKGQPLYGNTRCTYYPLGESQFEAMLADMEKAKHFIFLEYFIIRRSEIWDRIQEILARKACENVEVRVMMDDIGSIFFPQKIVKEMKKSGIQVLRFNNVHGIFSRYYVNFRNHQKIAVIDGNVGYTGGANIGDEYVNAFPKFGHWKDTAIRLEGDSVWSLTVSFLQMWDGETKGRSDYDAYRPTASCEGESGFYQPFMDGPVVGGDYIAKNIYKLFIYRAKKYIYITTPYLVVDATMLDALRVAAKGGTDVRIIVPKIWDKWYVHTVTLSNYEALLEAGVRIFEYSPGFIHAKAIISDDEHAVIGTINMDFRSYYLHYENGVWICGADAIASIKKDMDETFAQCKERDLQTWLQRPWHEKCVQKVMRLFEVVL